MEYRTFSIDGPVELIPHKIGDDRGYFAEVYRESEFLKHAADVNFVQENQSLSTKPGTIRGIHFQAHPAAQGKLVRCLAGQILDIVVDLRVGSPTFSQHLSVLLTPEDCNQLWIPVGFGHAFCTLAANSIVGYRVTNYYSPDHDRGVAWNDPDIGIQWPALADVETLSPKDCNQPRLTELSTYFVMEN